MNALMNGLIGDKLVSGKWALAIVTGAMLACAGSPVACAAKLQAGGGGSNAASGRPVAQAGGGSGGGGGGASGQGSSSVAVSRSHSDDGTSSVSIYDSRDGKNVVLEIRSGQVTRAEINGQAVPPERIVREGNTIQLKDETGAVAYERTILTQPADGPGELRGNRIQAWAPAAGGGRLWAPGVARVRTPDQKSMIGVTLGSVDDALRRHFALKQGEATMVYSVSQGLPADQAGINAYDIIIGIEGKSPANEEYVRATLREKDPGSPVSVTVIQRGQTKTVSITPEKFDREKLKKAKHKLVAGGEEGPEPMQVTVAHAPEAMDYANLESFGPEMQRAFKQAFGSGHRWAFRTQVDGDGNVITVPDASGEDEDQDNASGEPAAAAGGNVGLERLHELLNKLNVGTPMVGSVVGPDGKSKAQVFVNSEEFADYQQQMAEWARERADLMRELGDQQREMTERMQQLRQQMMEMQQRMPRGTPGRIPTLPPATAPVPPTPPTPPAEPKAAGSGQS